MAGVNLFDLAAKISLDSKGVDSGLTATQKKVLALADEFKKTEKTATSSFGKTGTATKNLSNAGNQLKGVFQGLNNATTTLDGPLGGVAARFSSIGSLAAGITTSAGAVGVALGAIAVASVGAAVGIYKLVSASAEATGHLHDLSQQTGFAVETLSTLQNLSETSGGSLESAASALFIFETKMGEAKVKGSELNKLFTDLNISTTNHEQALRQAFKALQSMTEAETQATVGKKLFGRSVKDLLGSLKEAGGDFDVWTEKMRGEGLLVTTQMAKKGDELSDSITRMGQRFAAVGRQAANEFAPMVTSALKSVENALITNGHKIVEWAQTFADAARGGYALANAVTSLATRLVGLGNIPVPTILEYLVKYGSLTGIIATGLSNVGASLRLQTPAAPGSSLASPLLKDAILGNPFKPRGSGGGGGGRGGGGAKADPGAELLKQLTDQLTGLIDKTKQAEIAQKLLEDRFKSITPELKSLIMAKALLYDENKRSIQLNREQADGDKALIDLTKAWAEELSDIQMGADQYDVAIRKVMEGLRGLTPAQLSMTKAALDYNAAQMRVIHSTRERIALESTLIERMERQRAVTAEGQARLLGIDLSTGDETRRRRVGALSDEAMAGIQDLASNLTSAIDQAIYEGFQGGVQRGMISLLESLLDMLKNVFLRQLEASLAESLAKIGTQAQGGGGGWLGKILGIALGGIAGGFGGSGAFKGVKGGAGGFAGGLDYVPYDNFPAYLHKGERVMTAEENRSGGSMTVNFYVQNGAQLGSRETQRQVAEKLRSVQMSHALAG